MFLGIDIGSSSSKACVIDENREIKGISVKNLGTGTKAYEDVIKEALSEAGIDREDIKYTVVTGYGRTIFEGADKQVTEITCHARGVSYFDKEARTIVDVGGQDAKVIRLTEEGRVSNFVMNEKCAAGTGRFIEVMARVLGCELEDLSELADRSTKELRINNTCTVFAESEVISRLAQGEAACDVARGAYVAIAKRVAGMCNRVGYKPKVVMTGGVALNSNMVDALSIELGTPVEVVDHCQACGAVGAALFALEEFHRENN
ncbi:MAG: 2-hydroxyglutaryl-CoA dehydratase [Firmicutes bacterium]|nr:2-hydroxyglutaryl-CoA dehydratase [Bacillota bacterium]